MRLTDEQLLAQWFVDTNQYFSMDIQRELWYNNSSISACCRWYKNTKSAFWFDWRYSL